MTQAIIPGCEENPDPKDVIIIDHTKPMKEINMNETKSNAMDDADIPESFKAFLATGSSVIQTCRDLVHVTEIQKDEILRLRDENERLRKENGAWFGIKEALLRYGIMPGQVGAASELDGKLTLLDTLEDTMEHHAIENVDALNAALESLEVGKTEEERTKRTEEVLTLRDFKSEMDAIHEEFDIPKDVNALRKELSTVREYRKEMEDRFEDASIGKLRQVCGEYDAWAGALSDIGASITDADFIEEFPGKWEELAKLEEVASDHDISGSDNLDDTLTEWEDMKKYKEGFKKLAAFVDRFKEFIGDDCKDIPSTDVEDYD